MDQPLRLIVATRNSGKAAEFARLLGPSFFVEPLPPEVLLPEETGHTFLENAALKAKSVFLALSGRIAVLADDSGLQVDALDGRPGVYSARYAGEGAGDGANTERVLSEMGDQTDRNARFVCALALFLPQPAGEGRRFFGVEGVLEGELEGEPRGSGGFGYDPIFRPAGWTITLAEAAPADKDAVSHRGVAVVELLSLLRREGVIDG